ncbi:MAG TPA: polysaccharide biosynthesis C-terminal domain-containing protein [Panacibacter sp.]|nr:polysaccharide biosynthesis C-terminal domain-containing protein [Panacibacter sp.]HNP43699.1 polysaccharide biosynthesis C-terminal domain-containing protein [Panacibacter sp.]
MAGIRKQAIITSILVYIGVFFGALNTYLFVKEGNFGPEQYGLTRLFFDVGQNFYVFASLGIIPVIYKFYHYYNDNLDNQENDLLGRSFLISLAGFVLVVIAAYFFEPLVLRKFGERSALFVQYYFWVLPFSFGLLAFSVMEGYATALQKTILPNFLKETGIRMITTVFIVLYIFSFISFDTFMMLFAMLYVIIAIILAIALALNGDIHFHFKTSRVTRKFRKKMFAMQLFVFGGIVISTVGLTIDGLIIASLRGLTDTGVYTFSLYIANLIQIPQRSIQSIATGVLVRLWKDKNYPEISRIYQRSCINMLIISVFLFGNLWLNLTDGLQVLHIQDKYAEGIPLVLILGFIRIIDAGTGVNAQVIGASNFWKFEFISGVIMLALRIPLSYIFIKQYGIIGTAFSDLISLSVYNFIRFEFLRRKFGMQPFNKNMLFALLLSGGAFLVAYFLFRTQNGWFAIVARSVIFSSLVVAGTFFFRLTPDAAQLVENARKRLNI